MKVNEFGHDSATVAERPCRNVTWMTREMDPGRLTEIDVDEEKQAGNRNGE